MKHLEALEEMKLRELENVDLLKQIADGESKLRQQQNLYEAVRADRNVYSKNLVAAQDEIGEIAQVQDHEPAGGAAQGGDRREGHRARRA